MSQLVHLAKLTDFYFHNWKQINKDCADKIPRLSRSVVGVSVEGERQRQGEIQRQRQGERQILDSLRELTKEWQAKTETETGEN